MTELAVGSTSKITFAGAGLGFVGTSVDNVGMLATFLGAQSIGPNKVELANAAGVSLTPAGATYPGGTDPANRNIPPAAAEHRMLPA